MQIREVVSRKNLRTFIYLPEKIHANHKNWVPPLYIDEWSFYNPAKNHSFHDCDTVLMLAFRNNVPAGRIMGIINYKYNQVHREETGRLFAFDCYEDPEIAITLTKAVEDWCRKKVFRTKIRKVSWLRVLRNQ